MQCIAISSWSLNTFFHNGHMDWSAFCAAVRGFGLKHVELNNHFFSSLDPTYIEQLAATLRAYEIEPVNLAIDDHLKFSYVPESERKQWTEKGHENSFGAGLASDDEELRQCCIKRTQTWIDIAAQLGSPCVRNNTGGELHNPDHASILRCADSFSTLCDYAATKGICMVIENHGGISGNIDALDEVYRLVAKDNFKQVLDFGNWPADKRYESVERSVHRACIIHPKTHAFDARGEQTEWDSYRMAHSVMRHGYHGPWVIEYESNEQDRFLGIQLSIDMIKRCFAA